NASVRMTQAPRCAGGELRPSRSALRSAPCQQRPFGMAAPRQGLPVRLERAPQRGAAFALSNASKRARTRSIGSRSRGSLFIGSRSKKPVLKNRVPEEIEDALVTLALE